MLFIYYHELQTFLKNHFSETGEKMNFSRAVKAMSDLGLFRDGVIKAVDFSGCNLEDMAEVNRLVDQIQIYYADSELVLDSSRTLPEDLIVFKYPACSRAGIHIQEGLELNFVCAGTCTLYFEGNEYVLRENEVVIIPPHSSHDLYDTENATVFSFLIHQDLFNDTFFQVMKTDTSLSAFYNMCLYHTADIFPRFKLNDSKQFLRVFLSMYSEFNSLNEYHFEVCANYIRILFVYLIRQSSVSFEPHALGTTRSALDDMPAILQYIKDNFKAVSLDALADRFHYGRSYLGKQIRRYTSQTFSDLITAYRLNRAVMLLTRTPESIERIAEESGYQSADHFSRAFRKHYGVSPSGYRKNHHESIHQ
ncbi:MAG: helix-turn-helix transcriptional regulator [Clostridia bacterium]|nr:helix-turn-helix transcriptional regulator [Clostridia bacterium]